MQWFSLLYCLYYFHWMCVCDFFGTLCIFLYFPPIHSYYTYLIRSSMTFSWYSVQQSCYPGMQRILLSQKWTLTCLLWASDRPVAEGRRCSREGREDCQMSRPDRVPMCWRHCCTRDSYLGRPLPPSTFVLTSENFPVLRSFYLRGVECASLLRHNTFWNSWLIVIDLGVCVVLSEVTFSRATTRISTWPLASSLRFL